jgi:anionic cell wall polymer biosynthesis LytR-Cps2A-Psr (LCP) family protein
LRQRRDYVHPDLNFTDLDRARRQQAFIISMTYQLKQGGAFTNPAECAKQNTAWTRTSTCLTSRSRPPTSPAATSPS